MKLIKNKTIYQKIPYNSIIKLDQDQKKKRNAFERVNALYEGREVTLNTFKSGIFPLKT